MQEMGVMDETVYIRVELWEFSAKGVSRSLREDRRQT